MGGPFALDGCCLMEGHSNQPKVDIDDGRGIEEERLPGRNMGGGGVSLCLERQIDEEKKQQRKYVVALDSRRQIKITRHPT